MVNFVTFWSSFEEPLHYQINRYVDKHPGVKVLSVQFDKVPHPELAFVVFVV